MNRGSGVLIALYGEIIGPDKDDFSIREEASPIFGERNVVLAEFGFQEKRTVIGFKKNPFYIGRKTLLQGPGINGLSALHIQDKGLSYQAIQRDLIDRGAVFQVMGGGIHMGAEMGPHFQ